MKLYWIEQNLKRSYVRYERRIFFSPEKKFVNRSDSRANDILSPIRNILSSIRITISKNPIDVKLFFMYKVSGEILKNETLIEFELFDQFGWTADDGGDSNLWRM